MTCTILSIHFFFYATLSLALYVSSSRKFAAENIARISKLEKQLREASQKIQEREEEIADIEQSYKLSVKECKEAKDDIETKRKRIVELEALLGNDLLLIPL